MCPQLKCQHQSSTKFHSIQRVCNPTHVHTLHTLLIHTHSLISVFFLWHKGVPTHFKAQQNFEYYPLTLTNTVMIQSFVRVIKASPWRRPSLSNEAPRGRGLAASGGSHVPRSYECQQHSASESHCTDTRHSQGCTKVKRELCILLETLPTGMGEGVISSCV